MATSRKGCKRWTSQEIRQIDVLARQGLLPRQIAEHVPGRSAKSILGKLQREGLAGYSVPPEYERLDKQIANWAPRPSRAKAKQPEPTSPRRFSWQESA